MSSLPGSAEAHDGSSLASIARLCFGQTPIRGSDWARLLDVAIRERCAPLAWLRSAETIQRDAPAEIARRWRGHALCNADAALGQSAELEDTLRRLRVAGVEAAVLKGLPLSVVLYGDISARPSTDFDLVVATPDRKAAHDVLSQLGWRHKTGHAPWESMYVSTHAAYCRSLELHSSLTDDNLLSHAELPVDDVRLVECGGARVPAVSGAPLLLFLSTHLAKHGEAPLLWWIDFATMCANEFDRSMLEVRALASRTGLSRFLRWALHGAELLREVIEAPDNAAAGLMVELRSLHAQHNALRVARLTEGWVDASRVLFAWAWPRPMRRHVGVYVADAVRRARHAPRVLRHNASLFRAGARGAP